MAHRIWRWIAEYRPPGRSRLRNGHSVGMVQNTYGREKDVIDEYDERQGKDKGEERILRDAYVTAGYIIIIASTELVVELMRATEIVAKAIRDKWKGRKTNNAKMKIS